MDHSPSSMPMPVKIGLLVATGTSGGFIIREMARSSSAAMWVVGIGVIVIVCITGLVVLLQRTLKKGKSKQFVKGITPGKVGGGGPAQVRAQREDMRRRFLEGVDKLKDRGIDPYELPWYVVVGESGGGKTELLRRSGAAGAGSYGMTDPLQGVGGTLNMNWWFYNRAVILDTAGRLWEDRENPGSLSEWEEFLRLLVKSRNLTPINGLILVVPATSLLRDRADDIDTKTATIVEQLHRMRAALEIRFPVYILVSKCDLIPGFREFFEHITQPDMQHQILGWSNQLDIDQPLQLDAPVADPDAVFGPGQTQLEHDLNALVDRFAVRRLALLRDPTPAGPSGRRLDDVDGIFAFPDQLRKRIVPSLAQYVTKIFAAGRYDRRPLFLRGIYFTSSMREGSPLDEDLALLLGKTLEDFAAEEDAPREERAYFLRDLFDQKIFREPGLVSRSAAPRQQFRRFRAALIAFAFVGIAGLFGLSLLASRRFREGVGDDLSYWQTAAEKYWEEQPEGRAAHAPIVVPRARGSQDYDYKTGIEVGSDKLTVAQYHKGILETLDHEVKPPWLIKHFVGAEKLANERRQGQQILYHASVLVPLVEAARHRMAQSIVPWSETTQLVLAFLIKLELASAADQPDTPIFSETDFDALMDYVLGAGTDAWKPYDSDPAREGLRRLFAENMAQTTYWQDLRLGLTVDDKGLRGNPAVSRGVQVMMDTYCTPEALNRSEPAIQAFSELGAKAAAWEDAEAQLLGVAAALQTDTPQWLQTVQPNDVTALLAQWREKHASFQEFAVECTRMLAQLEAYPQGTPIDRYRQAVKTAVGRARTRVLDTFLAQLGLPPAENTAAQEAFAVWLRQRVEGRFQASAADFDDPQAKRNLQYLGTRFLSPIPPVSLADIPASMDDLKESAKLLAYAYQIRSMMYEAASRQGTTEPDESAAEVTWDVLANSLESIHWLRQLAPTAVRVPEASQVVEAMLTVSTAAANHRKAQALLAGVPADRDAIVAAVDRAARQALKMPVIPFTAMQGVTFTSQYTPDAAATIVASWNTRRDAIKSAPALLDAAATAATVERIDAVYRTYLADAAAYWSREVPGQVVVAPFASWAEAHAAVGSARAWQIASGFEDICKAMELARPLVESTAAAAGDRRWRDLATELQQTTKQVSNAAFTTQCDSVMRRWAQLPEDPNAARQEVLVMKAPDFVRDFFVFTPGSGNSMLNRYWDGLSYELLNTLSRESQKLFEPMIRDARSYQRWPLNHPGVGPALLPTDIEAARTLLTALGTGPAVGAPGSLGSGRGTGTPSLDRLVDDLRRVPLPEGDDVWVLQALAVAELIPGNAVLQRGASLRLGAPRPGDAYAFSRCWTWGVISQGDRRVAQLNTGDTRQTIELTWHPGEALKFEFFLYPEDERPDKVLTIEGPWAPLKLLFRTDNPTGQTTEPTFGPGKPSSTVDTGDSKHATTWTVPIGFNDPQGHRRELELDITFDRPIPVDWPTR